METINESTPHAGAPRRSEARDAPGGVSHLIPEHLAFLIRERPLIWYEDPIEYDAFRDAIFAQFAPRDPVDILLVRDLVYCLWELRREQRLNEAAINTAMPHIAPNLLVHGNKYDHALSKDRDHVCAIACAAAAREHENAQEEIDAFNVRAREQYLRHEFLHYETYKQEADTLQAISRRIERQENRRDKLLKQIEGRRAAMTAMAPKLAERDFSTAIDIEVEG